MMVIIAGTIFVWVALTAAVASLVVATLAVSGHLKKMK